MNIKALTAELVGTFWLVLGGCGAAVLAARVSAARALQTARYGDEAVRVNALAGNSGTVQVDAGASLDFETRPLLEDIGINVPSNRLNRRFL